MATTSVSAEECFNACVEYLTHKEEYMIRQKEQRIKSQMLPKWNRWYHATEERARRELGIDEGKLSYPWELLNPMVYNVYRMAECMVVNGHSKKEIILDDYEYCEIFGAVR